MIRWLPIILAVAIVATALAEPPNPCNSAYTRQRITDWMNNPRPENFGRPKLLDMSPLETIESPNKRVVVACYGNFIFEGVGFPVLGTWSVLMNSDLGSTTIFRPDAAPWAPREFMR